MNNFDTQTTDEFGKTQYIKIPKNYILVEYECPKCKEEYVYGDYDIQEEFDGADTHHYIKGEFLCTNCNYKFIK